MSDKPIAFYVGSLPRLSLEDILTLAERLLGRPVTPEEAEEAPKAFSRLERP